MGNKHDEISKEFETWLTLDKEQGGCGLEKSKALSYKSAIDKISAHYSKETGSKIDLYSTTATDINNIDTIRIIANEYGIHGRYYNIGNSEKGTYREGIALYAEFVECINRGNNIPEESDDTNPVAVRDEFVKWMLTPDGEIKNQDSAKIYKSGVDDISEHYSQEINKDTDLYTITDINDIKWYVKEFSKNGKYYDYGNQMHGKYRAVIRKYAKFLEYKKTGNITFVETPKQQNMPRKVNVNSEDKLLIITKAFMIILPVLAKYVGDTLKEYDENEWWQKYVLKKLYENNIRDLPKKGSDKECIESLDISACLNIIKLNWDNIFKQKMNKKKILDCTHSLLTIRNEESHFTTKKLKAVNDEDIDHALSTMILFMRPIDTGVADQISEIKREFESR